MKGVLLLAHGTPESVDQMPEYLARVREGRPPSPELIEEMRRNYIAIGGRSPLTDITRSQADALRAELADGTPVYVGMRNWRPFIAQAIQAAVRDGVDDLVALPLAPQYSALSVGKYRDAVLKAAPGSLRVRFVSAWHDHPGLLAAFAEKLRGALRNGDRDAVVFTAHSLPLRVVREGDPYADQVQATSAGVAALAGLGEFHQAWQSAGRTPEPWLGPSLEERLAGLAAAGRRRVLVAPVGFVCDHTEILFDIDVQAQAFAREHGMDLARTESLNVTPALIGALADIVRRNRD